MKVRAISDEVLYALNGIICIGRSDIVSLKSMAERNARKRVRICAHPDAENGLHEMLIVLCQDNYIRPHRHPGKSESFHVIEGRADVVLFDDEGQPIDRIELGDRDSGLCFYFRLDRFLFHTIIVRSEYFVFQETTNGPFVRTGMEFASWSPEEADVEAGALYLKNKTHSMEV